MNNKEELYLPKTHNRWPIKHRGIPLGDRLELLTNMLQNEEIPNTGFFPHSKYYYVRAALEAKFNRHFSPLEVKHILEDKSWQWRDTSSQTQEVYEG